jgi:hypothetical protein
MSFVSWGIQHQERKRRPLYLIYELGFSRSEFVLPAVMSPSSYLGGGGHQRIFVSIVQAPSVHVSAVSTTDQRRRSRTFLHFASLRCLFGCV